MLLGRSSKASEVITPDTGKGARAQKMFVITRTQNSYVCIAGMPYLLIQKKKMTIKVKGNGNIL